jgi:hypothetical protein
MNSCSIPFDHSSTVKTIQEIFHAKPLLDAPAYEGSFARLGMVSDDSKGHWIYVPQGFRKPTRWIPINHRGKVICVSADCNSPRCWSFADFFISWVIGASNGSETPKSLLHVPAEVANRTALLNSFRSGQANLYFG